MNRHAEFQALENFTAFFPRLAVLIGRGVAVVPAVIALGGLACLRGKEQWRQAAMARGRWMQRKQAPPLDGTRVGASGGGLLCFLRTG